MSYNPNRERQGATYYDKREVAKALDMAGKWYAEQSERLGVEPAEIEDAILRGWTGDMIANLPIVRAEELTEPPPADAEHEAALQKIMAAPIRPMHLDHEILHVGECCPGGCCGDPEGVSRPQRSQPRDRDPCPYRAERW